MQNWTTTDFRRNEREHMALTRNQTYLTAVDLCGYRFRRGGRCRCRHRRLNVVVFIAAVTVLSRLQYLCAGADRITNRTQELKETVRTIV